MKCHGCISKMFRRSYNLVFSFPQSCIIRNKLGPRWRLPISAKLVSTALWSKSSLVVLRILTLNCFSRNFNKIELQTELTSMPPHFTHLPVPHCLRSIRQGRCQEKSPERAKYFDRFRTDNYTQHLRVEHQKKWAEYQLLTPHHENNAFLREVKVPTVNRIKTHFEKEGQLVSGVYKEHHLRAYWKCTAPSWRHRPRYPDTCSQIVPNLMTRATVTVSIQEKSTLV